MDWFRVSFPCLFSLFLILENSFLLSCFSATVGRILPVFAKAGVDGSNSHRVGNKTWKRELWQANSA